MRCLQAEAPVVTDRLDEAAAALEAGRAASTTIGGLGANLVSTVRSFLPFVSSSKAAEPAAPPAAGKKPVKARASAPLFSS
jgi:hypothetical protein